MTPTGALAAIGPVVLALLPAAADARTPAELPGRASLGFVANPGRFPAEVLAARLESRAVTFVTALDFGVSLRGAAGERAVVRFRPESERAPGDAPAKSSSVAFEDERPGRLHFLHGTDPAGFATDRPHFGRVVVAEAWPGVDLVFHARDGGVEYDLHRAARADFAGPLDLMLRVDGALRLAVGPNGDLHVETPAGRLVHTAPQALALGEDGRRRALPARFEVRGPRRVAIVCDGAALHESVIVDPGLAFATYLGGGLFDELTDVAVGTAGHVHVCGTTYSSNFPTTPGAYDASFNGVFRDAVVAKLAPDGKSLVFATFLGGLLDDAAHTLAVDAAGQVTVGGSTESVDFPSTSGVLDPSANGGRDGFVTRLAAGGGALVFSTYLGGTATDEVRSLALDAAGGTTVAGFTSSANFPVTAGAFDDTYNGPGLFGGDAFVARLTPGAGALAFSTYLGGSSVDDARAVALLDGEAVVAGRTDSSDFPATAGAFQTLFGGGVTDGFVARVSASGASLRFSTFVGGDLVDVCESVAAAAGRVHATGSVRSVALPFQNGLYPWHVGGEDILLLELDGSSGAQVRGSYLGGSSDDRGLDLAVDPAGAIYLTGRTASSDLPAMIASFDATFNGGRDAFFMKLKPDAQGFHEATFFGGGFDDEALALARGPLGEAILAGRTASVLPVTVGVLQPLLAGSADGFVASLPTAVCSTPPAAVNYGNGKAGANGVPSLSALNLPAVPSPDFQVWITNGLPGAVPLLFFGVTATNLPFDKGALLVDPLFVIGLPPLNELGRLVIPIAIGEDPNLCGVSLFLQVMYVDPAAAGAAHTAQTRGLQITFGS